MNTLYGFNSVPSSMISSFEDIDTLGNDISGYISEKNYIDSLEQEVNQELQEEISNLL